MLPVAQLFKNPSKAVRIFDKLKISKLIPDKAYLKLKYKAYMGKKPDLDRPKTFNEKLNWLKLYDRNPQYTMMVDKYAVKEYVAGIIGSEYIIPTLGVWDRAEDVDFGSLPEAFALKCTHDSGGIVICKDKSRLDAEGAKKTLRQALKNDLYYLWREWPYKNVKRRIIAEQYMEDTRTGELRDYKFFCFDGVPRMLFVASERQNPNEETKFDFFDMDYRHVDVRNGHPNAKVPPEKPENFELMKELAAKLSKGLPHVRVDLYEVNGKVYFGELTFFHFSGFVPFRPEQWDRTLGDWLTLPEKYGKS